MTRVFLFFTLVCYELLEELKYLKSFRLASDGLNSSLWQINTLWPLSPQNSQESSAEMNSAEMTLLPRKIMGFHVSNSVYL